MASGSLPHTLHTHGTSATNGGQSFAGLNLGTVNYAKSDNGACKYTRSGFTTTQTNYVI